MSRRVDYDKHGLTYSRFRPADPRIARRIHAALGDARTVVNVGAGTGSYEPEDRWVLAVEPSATMRAQRPAAAAPAISARAEALPLDDGSVDGAMACVTIHHWEPPAAGLAEMRRVARGPVVVFTFELECLPAWQRDYLAPGLEFERPRFPSIDETAAALGGRVLIERLPTPADCADGFFEAFWRRPEALLDPPRPQLMRTYVRMTSEGNPYARFRRALDTGNEALITAAARELPQISLDDALRICLVLRGGDPIRYERAAVRWLGRFALEAREVTIDDLRMAADALDALPERAADAMERLQRLCLAHGVA